ncbi:hypothetical protein, partial [Glaesserella parasuis]|uniref:hypothetical protein n=1 Tax=Glaesserella parasuis TaxID=738 RepID=UPI00243727C2
MDSNLINSIIARSRSADTQNKIGIDTAKAIDQIECFIINSLNKGKISFKISSIVVPFKSFLIGMKSPEHCECSGFCFLCTLRYIIKGINTLRNQDKTC